MAEPQGSATQDRKRAKQRAILTGIKLTSKGDQKNVERDDRHIMECLESKQGFQKEASLHTMRGYTAFAASLGIWHLLHLTKLFNLSELHLIRKT